MDIRNLEERINEQGTRTYWENGAMIAKECTKCKEIKSIIKFNFRNKEKGTYRSHCKDCEKQYRKDNAEVIRERGKRYYKDNMEHHKEWNKQNYKKNKEIVLKKCRQRYKDNAEHIKERCKQKYRSNKEFNLQKISDLLKETGSELQQLNLPTYGYIYKFENTKTGHIYIGQTINPLGKRYKKGIIKGWIEERLEREKQKFKEELNEEDIEVTEVLDVAFCQYHLDKLEAYYINYYNSYNNGYNNDSGRHVTDDGIEEFIQILEENGLEFIDNKIIKKRLPKQA